MKGAEFKEYLDNFSALLLEAGAVEQAVAWRDFARIFDAQKERDVSAICKAFPKIQPPENQSGLTVNDACRLANALVLLTKKSAKKVYADDLANFLKSIKPFGASSVSGFVAAAGDGPKPSQQVGPAGDGRIVEYFARLEENLSNATAFLQIFNELKADRAIKLADAKSLAKQFAKRTAKTKADAFSLIWERHESLIGARERERASGGRTAA